MEQYETSTLMAYIAMPACNVLSELSPRNSLVINWHWCHYNDHRTEYHSDPLKIPCR